jgi:5-methylthioadenosine/S-adenosylhomocysteine deaminase
MITEMKTAALMHRVQSLDPTAMGAREVFRAATEGGAHVLGHGALGRLAEGYAADIIGVRLTNNPSLAPCHDPLALVVFCASGRDVSLVMVDGKILMRDGSFLTIDVRDTIRQVNATLSRLT